MAQSSPQVTESRPWWDTGSYCNWNFRYQTTQIDHYLCRVYISLYNVSTRMVDPVVKTFSVCLYLPLSVPLVCVLVFSVLCFVFVSFHPASHLCYSHCHLFTPLTSLLSFHIIKIAVNCSVMLCSVVDNTV